MGLKLTRYTGQWICIGLNIKIRFVETHSAYAVVDIQAPKEMKIWRGEHPYPELEEAKETA